ncbi:hypothetical protein [Natrononativus amylolyticus]|uniref:hypothetical protein n=1 Tax=Natrononativus amylolyticus TaxID=2963434 RepID=UPI0020CBE021|nr:hypothetical protein [Natrononativus amylolyticus]
MSLGKRVLGSTKRKLGIGHHYGSLELTAETIDALYEATPPQHAVSIQPNKDGGGITNAIDLLTAVHTAGSSGLPLIGSSPSPTHAFEMRNINGRIGFQYVMGTERARKQIERQLETFYPDAHVTVSEHPHPGLLPLDEGKYAAGAVLRLRKRENGKHLYPIRHMDIEGFENDPYGSITAEMIGERESDTVSDIAVQTVFEPAPVDWWKGGLFGTSIDDVADELKSPTKEFGLVDALKYEAFPDDNTLEGEQREASEKDRKASKIVREQRGEKGFWLNLRVLAVSDDPKAAIDRVEETAQMFDGYYESATEQGFEIVPQWGVGLTKTLRRAFGRNRVDRKMIMGVRAAAGLMHIPNESINTQDVDWSLTSHAGDVPADATRFSDWHNAAIVNWEPEQRSHQCDENWQYAVPRTWEDSHLDGTETELEVDTPEHKQSEATP